MQRTRSIAADIVRTIFLMAVLLAPILVYRHTFGSHLSNEMSAWTNMGTAMAGIYGPLLAALTLFVLVMQVRLQAESGKHAFDQAHVLQANSDITFYLGRLEDSLKLRHVRSGRALGQYLKDAFMYGTLEELGQPSLHNAASVLNREHSQIFAAWAAYQSIVAGLQVPKEQPYSVTLSSAQQRATTVLSFEMCVALDQFVWCLSEGRLEGPYLFSPLLRQRRTVALA